MRKQKLYFAAVVLLALATIAPSCGNFERNAGQRIAEARRVIRTAQIERLASKLELGTVTEDQALLEVEEQNLQCVFGSGGLAVVVSPGSSAPLAANMGLRCTTADLRNRTALLSDKTKRNLAGDTALETINRAVALENLATDGYITFLRAKQD